MTRSAATRRLATGLVVTTAFMSVVGVSARAAPNPVSVTVSPSEVSLMPGGSATGVLVLANDGELEVSELSVDTVVAEPASLKIEVDPHEPRLLAAASMGVRFTATRLAEGTGQDTSARFLVTYSTTPEGATAAATRALVAVLTVKATTTPAVIQAAIEANLSNVNETRPGEAAYVLTNPRETSVRVQAIEVTAPNGVKVSVACPDAREPETTDELVTPGGETERFTTCPFDIDPRSRAVLHLRLEPGDAVAPGPRLALIQVQASGGGQQTAQSLVSTVSFTVDVFAESDLLKALGVPIFLLLPGVVVLITGAFLITKASPWQRITTGVSLPDVVNKATATAVFGLGISLAMAATYPWVTDLAGTERDYVKAYGFRDFYYVFAYSFSIAVVVWALSWGVYLLGTKLFVLSPKDDAASLLRKFGIRGLFTGRTAFPNMTVPGGSGLAVSDRPGDKILIVPQIQVSNINESLAPGLAARVEDLTREERPFTLWRELRSALDNRAASINFSTDLAAPLLVERANSTPTGQEVTIVAVT